MKKGTLIPLIIIITALLLLGILTVYLTLNFGDVVFTGSEQTSASFSFQTEPETARQPAEKETEPGLGFVKNNPLPPAPHLCIWVGDSRTLGMMRAVKDDCIYIGAAGEGYDWFTWYGESEMRAAISEHPGAPVIFNLGVNDYDNMELYLNRYNSLVSELSGTCFYFLSVNPVDPEAGTFISNEQITDFNNHLKEYFPDSYIDGYAYLMSNGIVPIDGIHYDKEAYQMLHDFVIEQLEDVR